MSEKTRKKIKTGGIITALLLGSYLMIKYIFPLVWPFMLAYGLAVIIYPVVRFLRDKLHFHKNTAVIMTLIFALCVILLAIVFLSDKIVVQIMRLTEKWPVYEEKFFMYLKEICGVAESTFNIESNAVYVKVCDSMCTMFDNWQNNLMPLLMNNSLQTLRVFIDGIIVVVLTIMAVFYMTRDMEHLRKTDSRNIFHEEIEYLRGLVSRILKAYIKSQLIIMAIVALVCTIGLAFIGNSYNILLGILIGVLDALPLFGVGAVMIPWSIVYIFMGNYLNAAILFTVFIACYLIREFLEPRLMGQKIGLSPMASLISIYIGYQLFGFLGMIAGPLIYVFVREVASSISVE